MATQIVMDRTGDTRHNFDAKNADALLKAEERFSELTGAGFTAAVRTASGEAVVKRTFDPMYGPAVRCKKISSNWRRRSCINVSGLRLERVVLRAIMDISARAF